MKETPYISFAFTSAEYPAAHLPGLDHGKWYFRNPRMYFHTNKFTHSLVWASENYFSQGSIRTWPPIFNGERDPPLLLVDTQLPLITFSPSLKTAKLYCILPSSYQVTSSQPSFFNPPSSILKSPWYYIGPTWVTQEYLPILSHLIRNLTLICSLTTPLPDNIIYS